jgi:hypothetical protein
MKKSIDNLVAHKKHLLDSIEGNRQKLSDLWNKGIKEGLLVDHHTKLMERSERALDVVNDKILEHPDSAQINYYTYKTIFN